MEVDEPTREMTQNMPQPVNQKKTPTTKGTNEKRSKKVANKQAEPATSSTADASGLEKERTAEVAKKHNAGASGSISEPLIHRLAHNIDVNSNTSSQQPAASKVLGTLEKESCPAVKKSKPSSSGGISFESSAPAASSCPTATVRVSQSETSETDPTKIMALKIIISDEQEEQSNSALNQAVSSISGDHIPTIFLSSPAKSPAKIQPIPTASITPEETALAVSSLQGTEASSASTVSVQNCTQLPQGQPQETGFIQLLPANTAFGGQSSYFVVTDPLATADQHSSMMLLPSSVAQVTSSTSQLVATPPRSRAVVTMAANVPQTFSPGKSLLTSMVTNYLGLLSVIAIIIMT